MYYTITCLISEDVEGCDPDILWERGYHNESYATIKTKQKVKAISRFSKYRKYHSIGPLSTVTTQKLKYTCGWLRFHNNVGGLNSDAVLPH